MNASCSKMLVDHTSYLSSSKKSVVFLSVLLFHSPKEELIRDDPLQSRRNRRINHLKIREYMPSNWLRRHEIIHWFGHLCFFDPQHCEGKTTWTRTYFSLKIGLPTLEARGDGFTHPTLNKAPMERDIHCLLLRAFGGAPNSSVADQREQNNGAHRTLPCRIGWVRYLKTSSRCVAPCGHLGKLGVPMVYSEFLSSAGRIPSFHAGAELSFILSLDVMHLTPWHQWSWKFEPACGPSPSSPSICAVLDTGCTVEGLDGPSCATRCRSCAWWQVHRTSSFTSFTADVCKRPACESPFEVSPSTTLTQLLDFRRHKAKQRQDWILISSESTFRMSQVHVITQHFGCEWVPLFCLFPNQEQFRDLISRSFHHTSLRISSFCVIKRIPGLSSILLFARFLAKRRVGIVHPAVLSSILLFVPQFCLFQLALICKKPVPNSSNFRRMPCFCPRPSPLWRGHRKNVSDVQSWSFPRHCQEPVRADVRLWSRHLRYGGNGRCCGRLEAREPNASSWRATLILNCGCSTTRSAWTSMDHSVGQTARVWPAVGKTCVDGYYGEIRVLCGFYLAELWQPFWKMLTHVWETGRSFCSWTTLLVQKKTKFEAHIHNAEKAACIGPLPCERGLHGRRR